MNAQKIIDISVALDENTVIYPGTPPLEMEAIHSTATGSRLTKLTMCTHLGTHIDAPLHADPAGKPLDAIPLERFVGRCRVLDMTASQAAVSLGDVQKANIQKGERILLKTSNSLRGLDTYYSDFVYLSPEAARFLGGQEIALIAIDYFSIKQKGSTDNAPHTALLSRGIPIIEGVNLKDVEPGEYTLVALPLKFIGLDGSPCRAILMR